MPDSPASSPATAHADDEGTRFDRLAELIESVRYTMFTSLGPDRTLRARRP